MRSDGALYEVVLAGHVLCAIVGFGSILVTGGYAGAARPRSAHGPVPDAVRRYFRPGPNRASRVIFAVPVLGLVLAAMGGGAAFGQPWLWAGSGLWLLAAALAVGVVWPAEARIASLVVETEATHEPPAAGAPGGGGQTMTGPARGSLASAARRASWAAAAVDVVVVSAAVVMVARPGG